MTHIWPGLKIQLMFNYIQNLGSISKTRPPEAGANPIKLILLY
jgi:hypothetical protein